MIFTAGPPVLGDWYDATTVGQSVNTGERREVIQGASRAHYVSSGHLVYSRAASLFAVPFDAGTLRATGALSRILEGVREDQSTGASQVAVSANGSLAYVPGGLSVSERVKS